MSRVESPRSWSELLGLSNHMPQVACEQMRAVAIDHMTSEMLRCYVQQVLSARSKRIKRIVSAMQWRSLLGVGRSLATARPPKSQYLHRRPNAPPPPTPATPPTAPPTAPSSAPSAVRQAPVVQATQAVPSAVPSREPDPDRQERYGPLDVNLKPRDQLRPLLPTWNPPPTRRPQPEELEVSTRLRFLFEERWWAATVREAYEAEVRVGFDGWPSRHDQIVPRDSGRLFLHESFHEDYEAPPAPQRFQRPTATDAEGNPLPALPRAPKPKIYDPEKERMKRALRPPLPFNPEKERHQSSACC